MNRKGCGCKGKEVDPPKPAEKPKQNGSRIRTIS